jgi:ABC-type long-subunit fatty acid transport system fused permease/ATPase subunit
MKSSFGLALMSTIMLIAFIPFLLVLSHVYSKDKLLVDEKLVKEALAKQTVKKEYHGIQRRESF